MFGSGLEGFVLTLLGFIVLIIFLGAIFAFFYAIFLFVFSAGDPEKVKKARDSIRYMIIGIIMTLALLFVFPVIFQRINLPNAEVFTAQNIFNKTTEIVTRLLTFGSESLSTYQSGEGGYFTPPNTSAPQQNTGGLEL